MASADVGQHGVELLAQRGVHVGAGLAQQAARLFPELYALGEQFLQLGLALLQYRGGQLVLHVEKLLVLLVELLFGAFRLVLVLLAQRLKVLLHYGVIGHRLQRLAVTEIAELQRLGAGLQRRKRRKHEEHHL